MDEDAHGVTDAAHGASPGMPQLDFATFPNQIFWLIVTLIVIYFILTRVALPRISAVLAERNGTLHNDLAAAEDFKRKAGEAEEAYEKALADARAKASKIAEETRVTIQSDLNAAIAKADEDIAAKTAQSQVRIAEINANAQRSVEDVARNIAADIVMSVAPGQSIDTAALANAVAQQAAKERTS